jgi:hypothetical protein
VTVTYSKIQYKKTVRDKNFRTIVKINPLLIFNGDIPFYVERRIRDKISIEGSIGFTYTDYIAQYLLIDENDIYEDRFGKLGYSFAGALKFYPSNYTRALDEFYCGPEIRYRRYNTEVADINSSSGIPARLPEYRILTDFKMTFGYISYITDNVILDFYGGIGIRHRDIYQAELDYYMSTQQLNFVHTDDFVPTLSAGVKFGVAF